LACFFFRPAYFFFRMDRKIFRLAIPPEELPTFADLMNPSSTGAASLPGAQSSFGEWLRFLLGVEQGGAYSVEQTPDGAWLRAHFPGAPPLPAQGWKLHVPARPESARELLELVVPVLAGARAAWKIAASPDVLNALNAGMAGPAQIGKFLTVYPRNDEEAVLLARALGEATREFAACHPLPRVPSDQPLSPDSAVSYRFGGFGGAPLLRTPLGEIVTALRAPDGTLEPDVRQPGRFAPSWAPDPFKRAGLVSESPPAKTLLAGRFVVTRALHSSPRGAVFLAFDAHTARSCVVKQARRGSGSAGGEDSFARLRREEAVLKRLQQPPVSNAESGNRNAENHASPFPTSDFPIPRSEVPRFPEPIALVEEAGDLFLAMEDVPGVPLSAHLARESAWGRLPNNAQIGRWGSAVAELLAALHARGFVYRDLKPDNLLLLGDGSLRLVDFETVHDLERDATPLPIGTRGYASLQQRRGDVPAFSDDIYALGALLYSMATGADAMRAPDPFDLLNRPLESFNPALPLALRELVARCLAPDPAARPQDARLVADELRQMEEAEDVDALAGGNFALAGGNLAMAGENFALAGENFSEDALTLRSLWRARALALGETLFQEARAAPDGENVLWHSRQPVARGELSRDLSMGGAGPVLALAELCGAAPRREDWRETTRRGARWLAGAPPLPFEPLPGLYIGEAGIGAAILRAGQILSDEALVEAAARVSRKLDGLRSSSPDVFNGTAGRLRFHLLVWDETGDGEHLELARQAGEEVLKRAEATTGDGLAWRFGGDVGSLSGQRQPGYAHGAAGIGDTLLDLGDATGEARWHEAAGAVARFLAAQAMPCLSDESGLAWPHSAGEEAPPDRPAPDRAVHRMPAPPFWCHGAAGVGRFFLHAWKTGVHQGARELALGAARSVAFLGRNAGPTQCHGLAGHIEFLLDVGAATGNQIWVGHANAMGALLEAFKGERDGQLVFQGDAPDLFSPDYLIGYAGIAMALLRLSEPTTRPHQLSRAGFRFGGATAVRNV